MEEKDQSFTARFPVQPTMGTEEPSLMRSSKALFSFVGFIGMATGTLDSMWETISTFNGDDRRQKIQEHLDQTVYMKSLLLDLKADLFYLLEETIDSKSEEMVTKAKVGGTTVTAGAKEVLAGCLNELGKFELRKQSNMEDLLQVSLSRLDSNIARAEELLLRTN